MRQVKNDSRVSGLSTLVIVKVKKIEGEASFEHIKQVLSTLSIPVKMVVLRDNYMYFQFRRKVELKNETQVRYQNINNTYSHMC